MLFSGALNKTKLTKVPAISWRMCRNPMEARCNLGKTRDRAETMVRLVMTAIPGFGPKKTSFTSEKSLGLNPHNYKNNKNTLLTQRMIERIMLLNELKSLLGEIDRSIYCFVVLKNQALFGRVLVSRSRVENRTYKLFEISF